MGGLHVEENLPDNFYSIGQLDNDKSNTTAISPFIP